MTKTDFQLILGSSPRIKIIDFFMENMHKRYTLSEIRDNSKVSYTLVKIQIPELLELGIIEISRTVGKIKFYQLNMNNKITEKLLHLRHTINYEATKGNI